MTPKEIAVEIASMSYYGIMARCEIEKMFCKNISCMTKEEKELGLACLSVFDGLWNK